MISEPGAAKTLAWPGGAGVALPGKGEGGGGERGGEGQRFSTRGSREGWTVLWA